MNIDALATAILNAFGFAFCLWAIRWASVEGKTLMRRKGDRLFKTFHYAFLVILECAAVWSFASTLVFGYVFIKSMGAA